MADEIGKNIDSKFSEAVDTGLSGGGDDGDMDSFFEETFEGATQEGGGVAEYDEDLGWAEEAEAAAEEETTTEAAEEEETEEVEEVEEEAEETAEEEEEVEETEETEEEVETEETEEEEVFYDGERDFGETAVPTQYKDRMAANHGLVAKVSYFKQLDKRLQEAGTDLGALSLPKVVGEDPDSLEQFADIEQVMSLPDEQAREFVRDMDTLLRNMKNKAERHEKIQKEAEQTQQFSEEYTRAQQEAVGAIKVLELDGITKDMTNEQIINMAYEKLEEFESDEAATAELSQKEFVSRLRKMEDAVFALEDFAKVAARQEEAKKSTATDAPPTKEQIESAFKEFMGDQPDLDMVKNKRVEMQKSLIQTAIRKGWDVATPRDWLRNYQKFMEIVNANRAKKGLEKLKDEGKGAGGEKKKPKKKTGRANKYANKKPAKSSNGGVTYSNRTDKAAIDQIDDELDRITQDLVGNSALDDSNQGW